jgi:CheY-like chemotaxis protein
MLPKMSGLDVLKALKNDPLTSAIPTMILTGLSLKNAKQMQKDGACGFFVKSESMLGNGPESLLAVIDRILNRTNPRQK